MPWVGFPPNPARAGVSFLFLVVLSLVSYPLSWTKGLELIALELPFPLAAPRFKIVRLGQV